MVKAADAEAVRVSTAKNLENAASSRLELSSTRKHRLRLCSSTKGEDIDHGTKVKERSRSRGQRMGL